MAENPRRIPAGSRDAVSVVRTWKARTVFANAHALFFVLAACGGYSKYLLRLALFDVVRWKETGKILTDDLLVSRNLSFAPHRDSKCESRRSDPTYKWRNL